MSKTKASASYRQIGSKTLIDLPDAVLRHIVRTYLTFQEQHPLRRGNHFFNKMICGDRNKLLACYHVLTGQPQELLKLLAKDPEVFFLKSPEVQFKPARQVFYNVSPADLVYFLCDDDMWNQVKAFAAMLPEEQCKSFFEKWQEQQHAMGQGGADLLYVTGDTPPQYASCFTMQETISALGMSWLITISLKNPDGIVCWKDRDNQVHLYYANPKTKALEPIIRRRDLAKTQQVDCDAFYTRIENTMLYMKPQGASRAERSSNSLHRLFQKVFLNSTTNQPIKLTREGIRYQEDGVDYIDTHYDAYRVDNAYLKCIHLYQADQHDQAARVLKIELANALKKRIWMLQRYCEKGRYFYPLPKLNESRFQRCLMIFHHETEQDELLFDVKTEQFLHGFGFDDSESSFSIYKGLLDSASCMLWVEHSGGSPSDLIAGNRLTVDATNAVEFSILFSENRSP